MKKRIPWVEAVAPDRDNKRPVNPQTFRTEPELAAVRSENLKFLLNQRIRQKVGSIVGTQMVKPNRVGIGTETKNSWSRSNSKKIGKGKSMVGVSKLIYKDIRAFKQCGPGKGCWIRFTKDGKRTLEWICRQDCFMPDKRNERWVEPQN